MSFAVLIPSSLIIIYFELRKIIQQGYHYFLSYWNYSNLFPPIIIFVFLVYDFNDSTAERIWLKTLLALASFMLWLKFLYFLRLFKLTSYLIRVVTEIIYDIRIFLLIWVLEVLAFSDAFLTLSFGYSDESPFAGNTYTSSFIWTYRLCFADF